MKPIHTRVMPGAAFKLQRDDFGHISPHLRALDWTMKKKVDLVRLAGNFFPVNQVVVE